MVSTRWRPRAATFYINLLMIYIKSSICGSYCRGVVREGGFGVPVVSLKFYEDRIGCPKVSREDLIRVSG